MLLPPARRSAGAGTSGAWVRIRETDALRPAGAVFPTRHPQGGTGTPTPVHVTPAMDSFRVLVASLACRLIGSPVTVQFVNEITPQFNAWYGHCRISFNVTRLGKAWFERSVAEGQLTSVLHELGHEYESAHASSRYCDAQTRLGARAAMLALSEPDLLTDSRTQRELA